MADKKAVAMERERRTANECTGAEEAGMARFAPSRQLRARLSLTFGDTISPADDGN
jgi:hypothetical protein